MITLICLVSFGGWVRKDAKGGFCLLSRNLCVICSRVAAAAAHVRGSAGGDFLPFASLAFEIKFRHAAGARMIYTDEGVENLHEVCVK